MKRHAKRSVGLLSLGLFAILAASTAYAQISVSILSGTTETPVSATHSLGSFAIGDTSTVLLRLRNTSPVPVQLIRFTVLGSGFTLIPPNVPFTIAGNAIRDAELTFRPNAAASYSANLRIDLCTPPQTGGGACTAPQINAFTATFLASAQVPPELTVFPVCTGSDPNKVLFGFVERGQTRTCNFNLRNPTSQNMTISSFAVSGDGFSDPHPKTVPLTIPAGSTVSFAVQFTNNQVGVKTGALRIEAQVYTLTATSVDPPMPKPFIEFDTPAPGSSQPASAQQRRVSLRLPSPAPFTASGVLRMSLIPDSPLVGDDTAVAFLTGLRQVNFAVQEGSTVITLGGQTSAAFQTGTTSGRIRFTLTGIVNGFTGDPTTDMVIPRDLVVLDEIATGRLDGFLYLRLTGFDNTYSTGTMAFFFYDANGLPIATVPANFATDFQTYFTGTKNGSVFQASLQFPVEKAADVVKSVEIQITNGAGIMHSARVSF